MIDLFSLLPFLSRRLCSSLTTLLFLEHSCHALFHSMSLSSPSILLVSAQMLPSFTICVQSPRSLLLWDCFLPTATFVFFLRQGLVKPRLVCNHTVKPGLDTSSSVNYYPLENTANFLFASWLLGFPHWNISCKETDVGLCLSPWTDTQNNNKNAQELGVVVHP